MSEASIQEKIELITKASIGGYCYVKLLIMLPSFATCTVDDFKTLILKTKEDCGPYKVGNQAMLTVAVGEHRLVNAKEGKSVLEDDFKHNDKVFQQMFESKSRFSLTSDLQLIHIDTFIHNACDHTNVVCNHGMSARAVVTLIGATQKLIGGTVIDMDDLFGAPEDYDEESDCTVTPSKLKPNQALKDQVSAMLEPKNDHKQVLKQTKGKQRRNDSGYESIESDHGETILRQHETIHRLQQRLEERDSTISINSESVLADLQRKVSALTNMLTDNSRVITESSGSELDPEDSRSNLGALNNRYMRQGTVINMRGRGGTVLQNVVENEPLAIKKNVVVGYVKTEQMSSREQETNKKVRPINGLARPFRDDRLNLLVHFNTAVTTNMPVNNERGGGR